MLAGGGKAGLRAEDPIAEREVAVGFNFKLDLDPGPNRKVIELRDMSLGGPLIGISLSGPIIRIRCSGIRGPTASIFITILRGSGDVVRARGKSFLGKDIIDMGLTAVSHLQEH